MSIRQRERGCILYKLARTGELVHYLDVGGIPVTEAAGIETLLAGIRKLTSGDDALLQEAVKIFDGLYASYAEKP